MFNLKNQKLLKFEIINNSLGETVNLLQNYSDIIPIGFSDIYKWIVNRNRVKHKPHLERIIKEWEKVNFYNNHFSDIAQKTAFDSGMFGLQLSSTDIVSPEFTSEGTAPKCWINKDGKIYLYKASLSGAVNTGLEANSEYMSSVIAREIAGEESIPYELCVYKGKMCSKCELFTSEKYGYVPFYKILDSNRYYDFSQILKICSDMGYEREYRQMILIDSIVFNQDRHLGNFGFIVDNETFEIKRFAPLFDYNSSFLCNAMPDDIKSVNAFKKYEKEYRFGHKLGGAFSDIGRKILTPELKGILPKNIYVPEHDKYNLDKERLNKIMDIMEYNLALITESKLYHIDYLPEAAIDCKKENVLKKSEKKIKEHALMDVKSEEYKKKLNCEYMDINN